MNPQWLTKAEYDQREDISGGLPYKDVYIDPVQYTTAPFYDPTFSGTGFPTGIGAPGENKFIWPVYIDSFPSLGDPGDNSAPELYLLWKDATSAERTGKFTDGILDIGPAGLTNIQRSVLLGAVSDAGSGVRDLVGAYMIENYNDQVINQPLVIIRAGDQFSGCSRSVTYRIYYQIIQIPIVTTRFFVISTIDQETKTITISDPNDEATGLLGETFQIVGSTGNDGTYTKVSASFDTNHTDIVVAESLPDATQDGWIKT